MPETLTLLFAFIIALTIGIYVGKAVFSSKTIAEKKIFEERADVKKEYKTDGIILVEPGKSYRETKNYKWKSLHDTTIDFLAMKCPKSIIGKAPFIPDCFAILIPSSMCLILSSNPKST